MKIGLWYLVGYFAAFVQFKLIITMTNHTIFLFFIQGSNFLKLISKASMPRARNKRLFVEAFSTDSDSRVSSDPVMSKEEQYVSRPQWCIPPQSEKG
jgi:hypothetical protein